MEKQQPVSGLIPLGYILSVSPFLTSFILGHSAVSVSTANILNVLIPVFLGLAGLAMGVFHITRGSRRNGIAQIILSVLCTLLGVWNLAWAHMVNHSTGP
jgi:hypothetical protein